MKHFFISLLSLALLASCAPQTDPISQWRGPNRDGIYPENGLLKQWPDSGPNMLWAIEDLGNGYGSPVVTTDKIYVTGSIDSTAYLYAYNTKGQLLWKSPYGDEWVKSFEGSRSTPTVVGNMIYVSSGKGDVACLDATSGEKKWGVNILRDLHGVNTAFGYTESLLVNKDLVYCAPGGADTNIVALDRFTGSLKWSSPAKGQVSAFCSPKLINQNGREILMTFSEQSFLGLDAQTGQILWAHPIDTTGNVHSNTPVVDLQDIYYTDGDGNRTVKLHLSDSGTQIQEVWRNRSFDNIMGGVVQIGKRLYGTGHRKQYLKCLDMETGLVIDSLNTGRGSTIYADGLLYVYTERGTIKLVDPKESGMEQISSFRVTKGTKEHFSHPVINNGVLYVRHGKALIAYDIKNS
jgi:outer membrane protein assembly factor BamB